MPKPITPPIVHTRTESSYEVTSVIDNHEEGVIETHYITYLDDGTPFQRGVDRVAKGSPEADDIDANVDSKKARGKANSDAVKEAMEEHIHAKKFSA